MPGTNRLLACSPVRKPEMPLMAVTNSLAIYQLAALYDAAAHAAPRLPFTIEQSHLVMQVHVACRATRCLRKAAELDALVEAGRVVPSASKPR
ncbi:hypothetical protein ACWF82_10170 [Nocardia sp. NPDC055053]